MVTEVRRADCKSPGLCASFRRHLRELAGVAMASLWSVRVLRLIVQRLEFGEVAAKSHLGIHIPSVRVIN